MAITRRYASWPPGEQAWVGMDFSDVLPPGVSLATATLTILTNTSPANPVTDFTQGPVELDGRQAWSQISGGSAGTDYQFRWTVGDNHAQTWQRTALLLCAETS